MTGTVRFTLSKSRALIVGALLVFLALVGVAIAPTLVFPLKSIAVVGFPPLSYPDFNTWPTPRDFDGPGSMFTLDKSYLNFRGTLPIPVELAGNESIPQVVQSGSWSGSVLAAFMGVASGELAMKSGKEYKVMVTLDGAQRWRVDPDKLRIALVDLHEKAKLEHRLVVTEAISVTKISYHFSAEDILSNKDSFSLGKANAQGSLTARKTDTGGAVLEATYSKPHYLFYRVVEFVLLQGLEKPTVVLAPKLGLSWEVETRCGENLSC